MSLIRPEGLFQKCTWHTTTTTQDSRMSAMPPRLPASAKCSVEHFCIGNVLTGCERRPMHKCSQPPTDQNIRLELTPFAETVSPYTPRGSPAVLGPQETVHLVTQRAREVLNDWHETSFTCFGATTKDDFALPLISTKRLRQNLVSALAKHHEAHNYCVQMQVRQLEQEADARLSQRQGKLVSQAKSKSISRRSTRKYGIGGNIISKETRWAVRRFTLTLESSSIARGRRFAATQPRACWTTAAHDRIGSGNTSISRDVRRISNCPIGWRPEVDRLERRDDEFLREARQHNNDTAYVEALLFGKRTNGTSEGQQSFASDAAKLWQ